MQNVVSRPNSNRPVNRQFLSNAFDGIPYAEYFDDASGRYSIDSVRLKFIFASDYYDFESHEKLSSIDHLCFYIDKRRDNVEVQWKEQPFRIGKYAHTATCSFRNGSSASFLIGRYCFNEKRGIAPEIVVDFNPNKVPFDELKSILFGLSLNTVHSPVIQRFDLAVDIPEKRSNVFYQSEKKGLYQQISTSDVDKTEYHGKRNSNNRLKLYNKGLELGLEIDVTRCEITLVQYITIVKHIPDVYIRSALQMDLNFSNLDFAVKACVLYPDLIPELKKSVSANTWRKYKSMIDSYSNLKLTPVDVRGIDNFVMNELKRYSQPEQWKSF